MTILGVTASSIAKVQGAFDSIASATGTGSSGTITFSSIPSTYTHLQIRGIARSTWAGTTDDLRIRFNGDTGNNYARHQMRANSTTASVQGNTTIPYIYTDNGIASAGASSNIMGYIYIDIHNYANTNYTKVLRAFVGTDQNNNSSRCNVLSGVWNDVSTITSISLIVASGSWTTTTSLALYGIKAA